MAMQNLFYVSLYFLHLFLTENHLRLSEKKIIANTDAEINILVGQQREFGVVKHI